MKKLFLLAAVSTVLLNSCSDERDEVTKENIQVKKSNHEFKLNPGQLSREELGIKRDTILTKDTNSLGPSGPTDPNDGNEVVDPTKPDKPW